MGLGIVRKQNIQTVRTTQAHTAKQKETLFGAEFEGAVSSDHYTYGYPQA